MTEKCVSKGNEEAKDEILDAVTGTPFNEADGNLQGDHGEQEIQEDNRTRDGVPNEEVDSEPKVHICLYIFPRLFFFNFNCFHGDQ